MSIPKTASEFFEHWVPARLSQVLASGVQLNTRCSILIQIGDAGWVLSAADGELKVVAAPPDREADVVFRVALTSRMFDRFVLTELANVPDLATSVPQGSPLLKLFNLDNESLGLIQSIPGALQLIINDGDDDSCRVTLAPGQQPLVPAACTLKCSLADAQALRAGTVQPMELFFGGRLLLEGDPQVAMALVGLFV